MDIDVHRQRLGTNGCRRDDVDAERFFTDRRPVIVLRVEPFVIMVADDLVQRIIDRQVPRLFEHGREMICLQDVVPGFRILRLFPAEIAHRRGGIGDAGIIGHVMRFIVDAAHVAAGHGNDSRMLRILHVYGRNALFGRPGQEKDRDETADEEDPAVDLQDRVLLEHAGLPEDQKHGRQYAEGDPAPDGVLVQLQNQEKDSKQ